MGFYWLFTCDGFAEEKEKTKQEFGFSNHLIQQGFWNWNEDMFLQHKKVSELDWICEEDVNQNLNKYLLILFVSFCKGPFQNHFLHLNCFTSF